MKRGPLEIEGVEVFRGDVYSCGAELWKMTHSVSKMGFVPVVQAVAGKSAETWDLVLYALHPSLIRKPKKAIEVKS